MEKVSCILVAFLVGEFINEAWDILLTVAMSAGWSVSDSASICCPSPKWTGVMTAPHYNILEPKEFISYPAFHSSHACTNYAITACWKRIRLTALASLRRLDQITIKHIRIVIMVANKLFYIAVSITFILNQSSIRVSLVITTMTDTIKLCSIACIGALARSVGD